MSSIVTNPTDPAIIKENTLGGLDIIGFEDRENRLVGKSTPDYLLGGNFADVLDGGGDRDIIDGGAGNDCLIGSEEDDFRRDRRRHSRWQSWQ
jgi:Ca2+-binding RTX toxin-like protein